MTPPTDPALDALAAGAIDTLDERALTQLAALYDTLDPVPGGLVDRIRFGITLDALHVEVAELQRSAALAGVRSDADLAQTVTFTSSTYTTMITITDQSADVVRVDGWIAPGERLLVELRTTADVLRVESDEDGRFALAQVPRGLAQLALRRLGADSTSDPLVVTPSIEL